MAQDMDRTDRRILALLMDNARMTVKEIAGRVSLTPPAAAERIRKMEKSGVIAGYTVRLDPVGAKGTIQAMISIYVPPAQREEFENHLLAEDAVEECLQVTGNQSHMVRVRCRDIEALNLLISRLQKMGQTNTQIILSSIQGLGRSALV